LKHKKRILIADDEVTLLQTMAFTLKRKGFETVIVNNGNTAINKIKETYSNNESYDLIITDIQMPGMSGLQLIEKINALDITVPILAISGYGNMSLVVDLMRAGCKDYLDKPFSMQEFINHITELLK